MNIQHLASIMPVESSSSLFQSFLSEINPHDNLVLENTIKKLRPNSQNYEDSWGYVIQATRYGGFKWHDTRSGELIFFGRKSEKDSTLVVPIFFATPAYLNTVINTIQHRMNTFHTILKNVNPVDIEAFLPYGFRIYKKNEGWDNLARFDDQTYPQLLIALKQLQEAKGPKYENLRAALRKPTGITFRKYINNDKKDVLKIFSLKDKAYSKKNEQSNNPYLTSHAMYPTAKVDKFVTVNNNTNEIIGFTAASDISSTTTALVASGFKEKKVSIWSIYQTLMKKYQEGFLYATLGGCESEPTYKFKREKFRPIKEIEKTHLVYDP